MNEDGQGFVGGALSGAVAGSAAGPWGTAAGFVIGGVLGLTMGRQQRKARQAQEAEAERLRVSAVMRELGMQRQRLNTIQASAQNRSNTGGGGSPSVQALDNSGLVGARLSTDMNQAPQSNNGTAGTF